MKANGDDFGFPVTIGIEQSAGASSQDQIEVAGDDVDGFPIRGLSVTTVR